MTLHELFETEGRIVLAELQGDVTFRRQQLMTILGVDEGVTANLDFLASRPHAHDLIASAVRWVAILEVLAQVDAAIPGLDNDSRSPHGIAAALGDAVSLSDSEHPVHVVARLYRDRFNAHRTAFREASEAMKSAATDHPFGSEAGS